MIASRTIPFTFVFSMCLSVVAFGQRPGAQQSLIPHSPFNSPTHETSVVSGTVRDMNNNGLKDVHIELTDSSGLVVNSTYTSASGAFEFGSVAPGMYTVVASLGVRQSSERVEANSWTSTVNLRLANDTPQDGVRGNSISVAQYKVPGKARDEYNKAHAALEKEKLDEAVKHLEKALSVYPDYADALTLRGVLELNRKDPAAAIADLDKAIKADGNYAMAYLVMGSALNMQAKFDEAIRALERGESLAPNSWQAHFEMGKAYIGKGDYPVALKHLERAQNMTPAEYPLIYLLQAHALLSLKQYSEAMSALESYLQKEPSGPNHAEAQRMLQHAQSLVAQKQ